MLTSRFIFLVLNTDQCRGPLVHSQRNAVFTQDAAISDDLFFFFFISVTCLYLFFYSLLSSTTFILLLLLCSTTWLLYLLFKLQTPSLTFVLLTYIHLYCGAVFV